MNNKPTRLESTKKAQQNYSKRNPYIRISLALKSHLESGFWGETMVESSKKIAKLLDRVVAREE